MEGLDAESPLARRVRIRTKEIKGSMRAEEYLPIKLAALPEDF